MCIRDRVCTRRPRRTPSTACSGAAAYRASASISRATASKASCSKPTARSTWRSTRSRIRQVSRRSRRCGWACRPSPMWATPSPRAIPPPISPRLVLRSSAPTQSTITSRKQSIGQGGATNWRSCAAVCATVSPPRRSATRRASRKTCRAN